jgi:hypothetical protein
VLESHPLAASAIRHVSPASSPAVPASAAPVPPGAEPEMLDGELPDPGFFLLLPPVRGTPGGVEVCWRSVADRLYALERSTNLSAVPCFVPLQPGVVGLTNTTCFTDRTATNQVPYFYRVRTDQ